MNGFLFEATEQDSVGCEVHQMHRRPSAAVFTNYD